MDITIYSVYTGRYLETKDTKKDIKKLLSLGIKGYLIVKDDYYSIKVYSSANEDLARTACHTLRMKGFDAFVSEETFRR